MTDIHDRNDHSDPFDMMQDELDRAAGRERSEHADTSSPPQPKTGLPDAEQAAVTHYAYDPQTYEILCRPGQRLTPKKAGRLKELNLYAHVVTFAE